MSDPHSSYKQSDAFFTYEMDSSESFTDAVVNAISEYTGIDPVPTQDRGDGTHVLDPLYSAIDPDALENLFRQTATKSRGDRRVDFEVDGYSVTVHSYGIIHIEPR